MIGPQHIPAPLAAWRDRARGRVVHVHDTGRVILRALLDGGIDGRQYAVYPSTTAACLAIERGAISWRLDMRHQRERAEAR